MASKSRSMRVAREVGDVVLLLVMGVGVLGCAVFVLLMLHVEHYAVAGLTVGITASCMAFIFRLERDSVLGAIVLLVLMEVFATFAALYYIAAVMEWA